MSRDAIQPDHEQLIICRAVYHPFLVKYHTSLKRKCRETQRPNLTPCFVRSENMSTCRPIRCTQGRHLSLAVGHAAGQQEFVIKKSRIFGSLKATQGVLDVVALSSTSLLDSSVVETCAARLLIRARLQETPLWMADGCERPKDPS